MRVERRSGLALSKWQMRDLAALNLSDGNMWPELVGRRRDQRECTVYLARGDAGETLGWALVYHTANLGGHDFHVYVAHEHRRNGYGTALHQAAVHDVGVVRTFAPDEDAKKFYAALDNATPNR